MDVLFGVLFFIAVVAFILGMIRPKLVLGSSGSRKKVAGYFGSAALLSFILIGAFASSTETTNQGNQEGSADAEATEQEQETSNDSQQESDTNEEGNNESDSDQGSEEQEVPEEETEVPETPTEENVVGYADAASIDIPAMTNGILEMSDTSFNFIESNENLFPAKTEEDITAAKNKADASITYKHLNKNPQPYFEDIVTFEGDVINIQEQPHENGETTTYLHVMDDNYNSHEVLLYKPAEGVLEDDRVRFWGAPVGANSFENISGGSTNTQFYVGSHAEKVN